MNHDFDCILFLLNLLLLLLFIVAFAGPFYYFIQGLFDLWAFLLN